jgi:hypothetical protein
MEEIIRNKGGLLLSEGIYLFRNPVGVADILHLRALGIHYITKICTGFIFGPPEEIQNVNQPIS